MIRLRLGKVVVEIDLLATVILLQAPGLLLPHA